MNKLQQLYLTLKYRKVLSKYIDTDIKYQFRYAKEKYKIDCLPTVDLLSLFPIVEEKIENYTFLEGNSLLTDIALLINLAKSFKNCSFLEIGSWKGETISNISKYANECVSITLSKEELLEIGASKEIADVEGLFMNNPNIEKISCHSLKYDFNKLNRKFDLIFIDGSHDYKSIVSDTKNCYKLLRDTNSVIVWHDYGISTENSNPVVLSAILDSMPVEEHKYLYHVSNTLCAIYIKKSFPAVKTVFPSFPNKVFSVNIKANKFDGKNSDAD